MPAGNDPTPINEILSEQIAALRALTQTLEAEARAIVVRDVDALNAALARKSEQLLRLKELETLRRNAAAVAAVAGSKLDELRRALHDVEARNRTNASLVETQRQHLARLLRLLCGGADVRHYGEDGRQIEAGRRSTLATA